MKNINYNIMLFFCMVTPMIYTADRLEALQEPLLHVARSVSSDCPPVEGGMRMHTMTVVAEEEMPDAVTEGQEPMSGPKVFVFDTSATTGTLVHGVPPRPSPRNAAGVLTSPRNKIAQSPRNSESRRNSKGSYDDDPETRVFLATMCEIAGKNTRSVRQHFRRLHAAQKIVANRGGSLERTDTTIDGELLVNELLVDGSALNGAHSREGSVATQEDVAQSKWIPKKPFADTELTSERIRYLMNLKAAAVHYKKGLKSFSPSYALASDVEQNAAIISKLTDIFHDYYYGSGALLEELADDERAIVDRDLKQAYQLGCCAGCSSCCSSCVIL